MIGVCVLSVTNRSLNTVGGYYEGHMGNVLGDDDNHNNHHINTGIKRRNRKSKFNWTIYQSISTSA